MPNVAFVLAHPDKKHAFTAAAFIGARMGQHKCGSCGGYTATASNVDHLHCGHCGSDSLKKQETAHSQKPSEVRKKLAEVANNGSNLVTIECPSCHTYNQRDGSVQTAHKAHCVACGHSLTKASREKANLGELKSTQSDISEGEITDPSNVMNPQGPHKMSDADHLEAELASLFEEDYSDEAVALRKAEEKADAMSDAFHGEADASVGQPGFSAPGMSPGGRTSDIENAFDDSAMESDYFDESLASDDGADDMAELLNGDPGATNTASNTYASSGDDYAPPPAVDYNPAVTPESTPIENVTATCDTYGGYSGDDAVALADDLCFDDNDMSSFGLVAHANRVIAMRGDVAFASISADKLSTKGVSLRVAEDGIRIVASKHGLRKTLNDNGFEPIGIKRREKSNSDYVAAASREAVRQAEAKFAADKEEFINCIALASTALATGVLEKFDNPLQIRAHQVLASKGHRDASEQASVLALSAGPEYTKRLMEAASDIQDMAPEERKAIRRVIEMTRNTVTAAATRAQNQTALDEDSMVDRMTMASVHETASRHSPIASLGRNQIKLPV